MSTKKLRTVSVAPLGAAAAPPPAGWLSASATVCSRVSRLEAESSAHEIEPCAWRVSASLVAPNQTFERGPVSSSSKVMAPSCAAASPSSSSSSSSSHAGALSVSVRCCLGRPLSRSRPGRSTLRPVRSTARTTTYGLSLAGAPPSTGLGGGSFCAPPMRSTSLRVPSSCCSIASEKRCTSRLMCATRSPSEAGRPAVTAKACCGVRGTEGGGAGKACGAVERAAAGVVGAGDLARRVGAAGAGGTAGLAGGMDPAGAAGAPSSPSSPSSPSWPSSPSSPISKKPGSLTSMGTAATTGVVGTATAAAGRALCLGDGGRLVGPASAGGMTIGLSFASFRGCGALLPTPAAGFACFADQLRAAPALANMNDMAASSVAAAVPVSALVRSFVLQTDGFLGER
jgi:hypothetical protein